MKKRLLFGVAASTIAMAAPAVPMAADFYAGKTVDMIIPSAPGGSYDLYARLIARNIGKHIAGNPNLVARNMPAGGGVAAANHLYARADKDGTVIGGVRQELALEQILGNKNVKYDAVKFEFIGRTNVNVPIHVVRSDIPVKSIEDVKKREVITGAGGARSLPATYPAALNRIIGTKWKVVAGYKGNGPVRLAFEKGEVEATVGPAVLYKNKLKSWVDENKMTPIVQYSSFRYPLFPDVPTMVDLAENEEDKRVLELIASTASAGRSFVAPPGVPKDRVKTLRDAFMAMTGDPAFVAMTKKRKIDIQPAQGEEILEIMKATVAAPPRVVARAKDALQR